jgi:CHAD domain-containing protein
MITRWMRPKAVPTLAKAFPLFALDPQGNLTANAPLMLHTRLAEMYRFSAYINDPDRVEELHNMRIAAKRLRYTMEIFAPCFPDGSFESLYDNVKKIQEQIGDIHDCDVRVPLMQSFLDAEAVRRPEVRIGVEKAKTAELVKRRKLYDKFCKFWNRLETQNFHRKFLELLARSEAATPAPSA